MKKFILILTALGLLLSLLLPVALIASGDEPDAPCQECQASAEGEYSFPIMSPSSEDLRRWVEAYNSAPLAPAYERSFRAPPLMQSLDLLSRLDYIPAERNQGSCGDCWAWTGTGVMEIALDVQEGIHDRLSVQYLNSNYNSGIGPDWACCGGSLSDFKAFYTGIGKAIPWSNTNAHWQDGGQDCGGSTTVPAGVIATTPHYPITSITEQTITTHGVGEATAIANIKSVLNQNRSVAFSFFMPMQADWYSFFNFWATEPVSTIWDPDYSCGGTWDSGGGGHAVLCVGYNDEAGDANDYWIMLNSWGINAGRPNGLLRVNMHLDYDCYFSDPPYNIYSFYWQTLDMNYSLPAVTTVAATCVTANSSTLNGNLTDLDIYSSANVSFEWGTEPGVYSDNTTPETMTSIGTFSANLSGLSPNTLYYYRAKATSNPTVYGSELSFTTANPLTSIDISPDSPNIALGHDQQFTATGTYADASTANITTSVTWTSDNTTVASIGADTGLAHGAAEGQATIAAILGAISDNTTLTVTSRVLDTISVTPPSPSIDAGRTQQFAATGTYSDASTDNLTASVTWSSSNTTIAAIDAAGLATGHAVGTAIIKAISDSISGNATLLVGPPVLDSITVTPVDPSVALGHSLQFTANGTYSDTSTADLTVSVTWTSDNSTVATINATGLATGNTTGITVIAAVFGSISGNTTLTVEGQRTLTMAVSGNGTTVPAAGPHPYDWGTVVNVIATPDLGWRFINWTGDVGTVNDVNSATTNITMNGDYTITASFNRPVLTMSMNGNGTVTPAVGTHPYDVGYTVNITATPDSGWQFNNWTGDVGAVMDVNAASTNITMNDDYTIVANFSQIVSGGGGGGSGGGGGGRGVTVLSDKMTPEGKLISDVHAPSSDLRVYLTIPGDTFCTFGDTGTPFYWISIMAVPEGEAVPDTPEGWVVITPYYVMEPTGAIFKPPITCTFKYTDAELTEGAKENNLHVMFWDPVNEQWVPLETYVDPEKNRASATLHHFSLYTLMLRSGQADIEVTGIAVIPDEITEGDQVLVKATISNSGEISGSCELVLRINGVVYETREIIVEAEADEEVKFELNVLANGAYRIELGGLTLDFSVLPKKVPAPAAFELSSLMVYPAEVDIGDEVEISVIAANTGESSGICELELRIDGEVMETRQVDLAAGDSEEIVFNMVPETVGKKIIQVNSLLGGLVVVGEMPPPEHTPLPLDEPGPAQRAKPAQEIKTAPAEESSPETENESSWRIFAPVIVGSIIVVTLAGYLFQRRKRGTSGHSPVP